jgi:hypothetical protein
MDPSYHPSDSQLEALIQNKGREVEILVEVSEVTWDYGESISNDYTVNYRILLEDATKEAISGRLCHDAPWGALKGKTMVQPYHICNNEDRLWFGPTLKSVRRISTLDGILYQK